MNLNDDVVYRCLRLGPLHQLHPGLSRSLVRYHNCLHGNFLLSHLSLWLEKCCSVGKPVRHLMPGAMGSFRKRRWNSALPSVQCDGLISDISSTPRPLISSGPDRRACSSSLTVAPARDRTDSPLWSRRMWSSGDQLCRTR